MKTLWQSMQSELSFLLISLGIAAGIVVLAVILERITMKTRHDLKKARTITILGMSAAVAAVLMLLEIPLFFAPSFYKLDLSELPVLICTFYLGPVAGVVCEFLKVLLKLLLKGTSSAFVGEFSNFIIGCSFCLPAGAVYQAMHSKKGAAMALAAGSLVMTVFGSCLNAWFLIPRFAALYGMPLDAIISMGHDVNSAISSLSTLVLYAVVPFNLVKCVLDSVLTFLLYKRVERVFFTEKPHRG